MPQQSLPRFVTVAELAELMRVSKMTVYRMIHNGDIPAVRVGKSYRVPRAAVVQLLEVDIANSGDIAIGG
ncbi:MAG: helix-turn-helix domain-containing protein [Actinomycetaceae bacterium]|nr:helix-turn-helix domain-containing protein [Actinomycetaceae bacterium]